MSSTSVFQFSDEGSLFMFNDAAKNLLLNRICPGSDVTIIEAIFPALHSFAVLNHGAAVVSDQLRKQKHS